jgi:hypothetical protein
MESGLQNDEVFAVDEVDEPVFFTDPPRPCARKHMAERFGLADPGGRVAPGVIDEPVDPLQ